MNALFLKIINMSISASWLILAILVCRFLLKRAPKWFNVVLWGLAAIRLLCPFSIESAMSLIPSAETIPGRVLTGPSFRLQSGIAIVDQPVNEYLGDHYFEGVTVSADHGSQLISILAILWLAGLLIMIVCAALSYRSLHRKVRTAVRYQDHIFQSENIISPFVLGIVRPKIYLPFSIDAQSLPYVVAHETAHIQRKDHWWKLLGFVLLSIYWFNPLMWAAYTLLQRDIELACDERVIKELDKEQRADYSQVLLIFSINRHRGAACPLAFGEVGVKERIRSILRYKKPSFILGVAAMALCLAVAVCFLTNPLVLGDHFVLANSEGPADTNTLTYDLQLGEQVQSGTLYVEQWIKGECIRSTPVVMSKDTQSITILMSECREEGIPVGTDIQMETAPYGGSAVTYFAHPEDLSIRGWSFQGYPLQEKNKLSSGEEVILAARAFDTGSGVRVYSPETLVSEPERLEDASYMIVVRGIFSDEQVENQMEEPAT